MIAKQFRNFGRDRKGATAMLIALMLVPMILACGAAVDFSRVSSARAQLQFAVDSAAVAGDGAYQSNQDGEKAYNVAKTAFNTSTSTLTSYAAISNVSVGTACNLQNINGVQCGSTPGANGAAGTNGATGNCPGTTFYCVQVSATATLKNSLLAYWIPKDVLSASATANTTGTTVGVGQFAHTGVGYGSDLSAIYVYAVPVDTSGNPEYENGPPQPNTYCKSSSYGPIQYEATAPATSMNTCNYALIGENSGGSGTGTINFQNSQPLAFTFVNYSGGTITSGTSDLDTTAMNASTGAVTINSGNAATQFTNEIYVSTNNGSLFTYDKAGYTVPAVTCAKNQSNCTASAATALYGYCPAHNLYGSINAYPNATNNIVPYQDSLNTYSTAWEVMGYPPTHSTNHFLLPFLGPTNTQTVAGTTYIVQAVCPQWPWPKNSASSVATEVFSPNAITAVTYNPVTAPTATYSNVNFDTVNVYATYYPDQPYNDGTTGANAKTYPPPVAGCSPVTSSTVVTVASSTTPWWGWSPSNAAAMDPGGAGENPGGNGAVTNCTSTALNLSGKTYTITPTMDATQSAAYNDCAFIIQPLGSNVPTSSGVPLLPKYYTYTVEPGAFTRGATGNVSDITAMTPVYTGNLPTTVTAVASGNASDGYAQYTVTEPPAYGASGYPPEDTSHQCYNPVYNGINGVNGSVLPSIDVPNNDSTTNPPAPVDPVANPQRGAVTCDATLPSFVLMWNDMGAWAGPPHYNDDLGYANALTEFTCPSPSSGSTGPATLIY